jgi:copper transport protein
LVTLLSFPRWFLLLPLLAAVAAGALFSARDRAEAHAVQVSSEPASNSQLAQSPATITINFSEPIEPSVTSVQLWDQSAHQVALGKPTFPSGDSKTVVVDVPSTLPSGIYTVVWRNLSTVDGHTWAGSFPFTVLGPNGEVPSGEVPPQLQKLAEPPSNRPSTLESVARWVVLLGTSVIMGGTAYVLFVARPASRRLSAESGQTVRHVSDSVLLITCAIAAFFALEGSLLQLVVQSGRLGGLGRADNLLLDTRSGHYLLARQGLVILALVALAAAWRLRGRALETVALGVLLVSSFGVLLTQSLVSHSAASPGPFWTTSIDVLHLAGAAVWIGMLIHVGLAMPRWLDELKGPARTLFAADSFQRFSLVAAFSVAVLLTSGILSSLAQFTAWDDLWTFSYGWSLIAKMLALLPLLAVAGLNAVVLRARVEAAALHIAGGAVDDGGRAGDPVARLQRMLANSVRLEAVLGIVVLVAAAVLVQLEPPRAAADAASQAAAAANQPPGQASRGFIQEDAEVDGLIMALKITPGTAGENTFELGLGSEFGGIGDILDTRLDFVNETAATGRSTLALPLSGSAKWSAGGSDLSIPGDYTITAVVHRRGLDDVVANFRVKIEAGAAGGPPPTAAARSDSIWHWPFEGARSIAAIALLAASGAAGAGWGAWRLSSRRRA